MHLARLHNCAAPRVLGLALGVVLLATLPAWAAEIAFLEDPGEGDFDVTGSLKVEGAKASARLVLNWQESKDHYLLAIAGGQAKLTAMVGGKASPLGEVAALKLVAGQTVPFTLQRRDWRLALVWGNRVVLRAYDTRLRDGKVGAAAEGAAWEDLRVQGVGDIQVFDDFVREAGAQSVWEPQCGNWQSKTLRDDEQAAREEADKSANAFSYFGAGNPRAITVAGHWFWDRYALEASVKPMGGGAAGLVCYYQDQKNYLALRFTERHSAAPDANRLQLVATVDDKVTVLAEKAGGYLPEQWYKLRLEACEDRLVARVDGEFALQAKTPLFGQGQVGLYAEGPAGVFFDDVACDAWEAVSEDFTAAVPGKWTGSAGFAPKNGKLLATPAKPAMTRLEGQWERYVCGVDSQSLGGGLGLVFAYRGPTDYCLVRWAPAGAKVAYKGKAQLVHVGEKGPEVLAEQPASAAATARLRAQVEDGLLSATVGDGPAMKAVLNGAKGGGVGLFAEGKGTFDNLALTLVPARRGSHVTKEFAEVSKHPEMAEWASERAPWVQPTGGQTLWWTKGDYFGETTLSFTVPNVGSRAGSVKALLAAEPGSEKDALALTLSATSGAKTVSLAVSLGDKQLGTAEVAVEKDAAVVFSREGRLALIKINDAVALTAAF